MRFILLLLIAAAAIIAALIYVPRYAYETIMTLPTADDGGGYVSVGSPGEEVAMSCPVGIDFIEDRRLALLDAETARVLDIDVEARSLVSTDPLTLPAGAGPVAMTHANGRLFVRLENSLGQGAVFPFAKTEAGYAPTIEGVGDSDFAPDGEVGRRFAELGYPFGVDEASLAAGDTAPQDEWSWRSDLTSKSGQSFSLDFTLSGGRLQMTLAAPGGLSRSTAAGAPVPILTARALKATDGGDVFVSVLAWDPSSPSIHVDEAVYRFNSAGGPISRYDVPLDESECVAKQHVAVSDAGEIYVLRVREDQVSVLRLRPRTKLTDLVRWLDDHLVRRLPPIRLGSLSEAFGVAYAQTELVVAEALPDGSIGPISRADIVRNACKYLQFGWAPTDDNLKIDRWKQTVPGYPLSKDLCACGASGDCLQWKAPNDVADRRLGLPYAWGGADRLDDFLRKITTDKRPAGDECTTSGAGINMSADPTRKFAAGVDCSGFVLRSWGWPGRRRPDISTSNLETISNNEDINWTKLRPGDIANRAGHHVVLIQNKARSKPGGPVDSVRLIQSTTKRGCDGVCSRKFRVDELSLPGGDLSVPRLGKEAFNAPGTTYVWRRADHVDPAQPLTNSDSLALCPPQ